MGILWARSTSIEFDSNGDPAAGAKAYFYEGGTTTPLTVYQDAAATTPHANPVVANSIGRWPSVYIPYIAAYDVKATTSGGTLLYYPTNIANPDPVTTAEDTTLPEERIRTGMTIWMPQDGTLAGFVRCNGRTIGSSGAPVVGSNSERRNPDCEALFIYLYDHVADASCPVSGGRTSGVAATDFAANKYITLPDMRGGGPLGLDTMGNSAASSLGSATFTNGSATTAGSLCGENTHALITAELASHTHGSTAMSAVSGGAHTHTGTSDGNNVAHTHSGTTGDQSQTHTHAYNTALNKGLSRGGSAPTDAWGGGDSSVATGNASQGHTHDITTGNENVSHTHSFTTASDGAHTHTISGSTDSNGSGTAHNNVSKSILGTWYIKL